MTVSVRNVDQYELEMELRMPFHFGNTTLTELPHLFVEVELEGEGRPKGVSSEGLSPLWFLKDPDVTFDEGLERMYDVVDTAAARAQSIDADTVFEFWKTLYDRQREWAADTDHPPLLWSFGVSMIERAVIDAYCRSRGTTFADAVRENAFGIELGEIYEELAGDAPAEYLADEPRRSTAVRHTVGFTDPLVDADLDDDRRLEDGLPQTLESYVRAQDLSHFKVKLSGDVEADADRLRELAEVLARSTDEFRLTVDANEQYGDAESFRRDWERLTARPAIGNLFESLLYVEQPLARGDALMDATKRTFSEWDGRPPVIIDESDGRLRSLERALECGYVGTSHKNCKGVIKGVANACLIEHRRRTDPDRDYVISGEDLTTIGPVSLLQDLAVMATLGKAHVERNGHHYFRGLDMYPADVQTSVLSHHDDLYRRHDGGFPTLDIVDGAIDLDSVVDAPFGYDVDLDLEPFTPRSPDLSTSFE